MLSIHIEMFLPRHEGEPAAQLQEEFLQVVNQGLFQARLVEVLVCRKVQELQYIGVFDDPLILRLRLGGLDLRCDALLVPAGQDTLII